MSVSLLGMGWSLSRLLGCVKNVNINTTRNRIKNKIHLQQLQQSLNCVRLWRLCEICSAYPDATCEVSIFIEYSKTPTLKEMYDLEQSLKDELQRDVILSTKPTIDECSERDIILGESMESMDFRGVMESSVVRKHGWKL